MAEWVALENLEQNEGWERGTSGRTVPSWFAEAGPLGFQKLDTDVTADVAIVGAGVTGITVAYFLAKAGRKAVVLDDGNVGSGETGRTTAHISHVLDDRYYRIEKIHGRKTATLVAESHTAAISRIESIVHEEKIDCDFERLDGYLFLDPTDKIESLDEELRSTHSVGILGTEFLERAPLPSFDTGPCLRFPNQAQFHPLKYLLGLARATQRYGGRIYTDTHVQKVSSTGVRTAQGKKVRAGKIVVATNAPIVDEIGKIYQKQRPFRSYVIAAKVEKGSVPKALYWDTGDQKSKEGVQPYHYARVQELENDPHDDLLIVGGGDQTTGDSAGTKRTYETLEAWTRSRFPSRGVVYRWSGQDFDSKDSLAFIGRNPGDKRKNVFVATGSSWNGITYGTIAGIVLSDMILGKENAWARVYNPARRIMTRSSIPEPKESPKPRKLELESALRRAKKLSNGQGMVFEIRRKGPMAFYRNDDGGLLSFSASCTHEGCTVTWNESERSFDCSCHGSRFSYRGKVISTPANSDLKTVGSL
ncbi:MAG TPA: FAD-dependent oxidoreductase [Nitrososphaerales archaeon]|nr:FAD-dependent oxidoreductase [Nitrososphaerales archaeon]